MRDRLIEDIKNSLKKHIGKSCLLSENIADDLITDGWTKPPCKSGDVLWYLDYGLPRCFMSPEKIIVKDVLLINGTILIRCDNLSYNLRTEDFGKTIFLTREEAEKALKGGEQE